MEYFLCFIAGAVFAGAVMSGAAIAGLLWFINSEVTR